MERCEDAILSQNSFIAAVFHNNSFTADIKGNIGKKYIVMVIIIFPSNSMVWILSRLIVYLMQFWSTFTPQGLVQKKLQLCNKPDHLTHSNKSSIPKLAIMYNINQISPLYKTFDSEPPSRSHCWRLLICLPQRKSMVKTRKYTAQVCSEGSKNKVSIIILHQITDLTQSALP